MYNPVGGEAAMPPPWDRKKKREVKKWIEETDLKGKCMMQSAANVASRARFLSSRPRAGPFIAGNASRSAGDSSPLVLY